MKERPILFSAPMVRAILDGKKTQTRRIVKPQESIHGPCTDGNLYWIPAAMQGDTDPNCETVLAVNKCPYGIPGDRLWVRESFTISQERHEPDDHTWMTYDADGQCIEIDGSEIDMNRLKLGKRYPSIHMPRWASRITLEVVAVRVERLQEISPEDALREGVFDYAQQHNLGGYWTAAFRRIWDSINGPESWTANPWVWVVEFKRLEQGK